MSYTEKGTVKAVTEIVKGTSQKGDWQKQSFIIDTDERYSRQVCFDVFASADKQLITPKVGQKVDVMFSVESREHNGKYYTNASAFKVEVSGSAPAPSPAPQQDSDSGLPF